MEKRKVKFLCTVLCFLLVFGGAAATGEDFAATTSDGSFLTDEDMVRTDSIAGLIFAYPAWDYFITWSPDSNIEAYYYNEKANEYTRSFVETSVFIGDSLYDTLLATLDEERALLEKYMEKNRLDYPDLECEWIEIDGHPASICTYAEDDCTYGELEYARNSVRHFFIMLSLDKDSPVTMNDLKIVAAHISYDEKEAPFIAADAELSIAAKGDPVTVTAGKNVQFSSAFANPERVNKKNKNDGVTWSVRKAGTDEAVEGVSIDAKGSLKVDKKLSAPVELQVMVASERFNSSASYSITAMPVVSKVLLEPAELFFYVGAEDTQTVKASLEPDTVPPIGLTWTPVKNGIVDIAEMGDGIVSIKPLGAGKTDVAVKEPGGKNAKLTVNVVSPVESVELKVSGTAKAGGKMKITAVISPKDAGNKAVEWSLDVGEDLASIDANGQMTIARDVPAGTKITVTCTATGAPVPVDASIEVEVQ